MATDEFNRPPIAGSGQKDPDPSMSLERRTHILAELAASAEDDATTGRLCDVGRRVIGVSGAGIMLFAGNRPVGSVCTASHLSAVIEELQFTLGEGPCVDAYQLGQPILEPNLAAPTEPRWSAFTGPALEFGVRAIFGFPVGVGAVRLGALDVYLDRPGPLTDDQHADALVFADVAAEYLLAMQSGETADVLTEEFEQGSNFHYVVHQAAGMVSAQLGTTIADALVRLRAHAFSTQRPLTDVAADVVRRHLRFADGDH